MPDAVIVDAVRTPIGRAVKGSLKSVRADDLAAIPLKALLDRPSILNIQKTVRKVLIGRTVSAYAVKLARATRPGSDEAPDFVKKYLTWGAGPRACQALLLGGKAHALLEGRVHVSTDDIRYVARPVLRHRVGLRPEAELEGATADGVLDGILSSVPVPQ